MLSCFIEQQQDVVFTTVWAFQIETLAVNESLVQKQELLWKQQARYASHPFQTVFLGWLLCKTGRQSRIRRIASTRLQSFTLFFGPHSICGCLQQNNKLGLKIVYILSCSGIIGLSFAELEYRYYIFKSNQILFWLKSRKMWYNSTQMSSTQMSVFQHFFLNYFLLKCYLKYMYV